MCLKWKISQSYFQSNFSGYRCRKQEIYEFVDLWFKLLNIERLFIKIKDIQEYDIK